MTDEFHFLSVKPLSVKKTGARNSESVLLNAAKHNLREILAEIGAGADSHIDPRRSQHNIILHGLNTACGVAGVAQDLMRQADIIKPRKNATLGIEIIFSLPNGLDIDYGKYFQDAMQWAQNHFDVPMLSATVHYDEDKPHSHVVMLPLRDGRLIGSELLGDRRATVAMHKSFHEQVGKCYGLRQPTPKKRLSASVRQLAIDAAFKLLEANSGLNDAILRALLAPHVANPEPLLLALGLPMPEPTPAKGQTFVKIMTAKTKPEKPIRTFQSPIGHLTVKEPVVIEPEKAISYALLGHCKSASPITPAAKPIIAAATAPPPQVIATVPTVKEPTADTTADDWTRERDDDTPAEHWHDGEPHKPPAKASSKRQVVESVAVALDARKASRGAPAKPMRC